MISASPERTRRILCCWMPNWALQRRREQLAGHHHVVYRGDHRRGRVVAGTSRAAAALGVRRGMPLAEAESLLPADAVFLPDDPRGDRRSLEQLAMWAQQFAPQMGVESPPSGVSRDSFSPETLIADVTDVCRYFGGEWKLVHQMAGGMAKRKLRARIAVAHSLGAAWGLAHAAEATPVIAPAYRPPAPLPRILADLPVWALRLPPSLVSLLRSLGLETVGLLASIPPESLKLRLDSLVVERLEQFLGSADEYFPVVHATGDYCCEVRLEPPVTCWERLEPVWRELATELAARLAADHRGALRLDVELATSEGSCSRTLYFAQPSRDVRRWAELWRLQREWLPEIQAVCALALRASITARPSPRRSQVLVGCSWRLADESAHWMARQWAAVLDRLAARLGHRAIFRARLLPECVPERSWIAEPPTLRPPRLRPARWSRLFPGTLPLTLLGRPHPLPLQSPELPRDFQWHRKVEKVRRSWGPRQIDAGWHEGVVLSREYYHLETEAGRRCWVFYSRTKRRWYLHGWDG